MEVYRTKATYSGTALNPEARGCYDTGKIGACKTWHVRRHASTKGGGNKSGGYTSAYAQQKYCKKST